MPGLTANAEIIIKEAKDVLLVSPKSLQFEPTEELAKLYTIEPFKRPERKNGDTINPNVKQNEHPNMTETQGPEQFGEKPKNMKVLWVIKGKIIQPRMVQTGMADGALVEVTRGVHEGDSVITAISKVQATKSSTKQSGSPFMPKPPQRTRNSSKPS